MVDLPLSRRKLAALKEYLAQLKAFRQVSEADFLAQPALHVLAERYLHLAVESVLDLTAQWIASDGLGTPATNAESFTLERSGHLSADLARRLRGWASFRNVLVHLYVDLDHRVSYRSICEELEDLDEFARLVESKL